MKTIMMKNSMKSLVLFLSMLAVAFAINASTAIAQITTDSASPPTGPSECRSGFLPPQCTALPFDNSQNYAFQGNGFAQSAVALDSISDYYTSIHQPEFANDGFYGNGASWIGNSPNSWLKIDLGREVLVDAIRFGRDRIGGYDDRDPGQFTIEVALSENTYANGDESNDTAEYTQIFDSATVSFSGHVSGSETLKVNFPPVAARFIKLTFSNFGAGIDEVEVHGAVDSDGDSVPDDQDICPGFDDNLNADSDVVPDGCDPCPFDPLNDADGDDICGDKDNCPNAYNQDQTDTDGDGVGDLCNDTDDNDGDEWNNTLDNCPLVANPDQVDADGDGLGDACDVCPLDQENDADGDGVCESDDNCPLLANSSQADNDGDEQGDACDDDDDNDNVIDDDDNCPLTANSDQADSDGDGAGDVCDTDDDNDDVLDADDQCPATPLDDIVNYTGCSISDLCPCDNEWKNHGAYVRCVANASEDFVADALITEAEKDAIVSAAAESECGDKK
jgi:hypothetical protein